MINILLTGALGRMGKAVAAAAKESGIYRIAAGIDINSGDLKTYENFPVFGGINEFTGEAGIDVIVDFSHHTALEGLLYFALEKKLPIVVATTGHTPEETAKLKDAAKSLPIFYSRNMSLGINLIIELAKKAAAALEGFDIEIIEKHHNKKLDAPSGTALMIADGISSAVANRHKTEYIYNRQPYRRTREANEIGIHSVRGGTIVGEHEVIFAGKDEIVTLSHSAISREIFAQGALRAVGFLYGKPAGLYNMTDIVNEIEL